LTQKGPVRGDTIRKAFESLDIFGIALVELLVENVKKRGITLDSEHSYSLEEIQVVLADFLGEVPAQLIFKRLSRVIDAQTV
jgi:hypothetical protein